MSPLLTFRLHRCAAHLAAMAPCTIIPIGEDSIDHLEELGLEPYEVMDQADKVFQDAGIRPSSGEELYLGALCDGKIVGASTFGVHREEYTQSYTFSVAVTPEYRRKGLARQLVVDTIQRAQEEVNEIEEGGEFRVWVVNPHMAKLLESLGFDSEDGEWSPNAPHMTLSLQAW